MKIAVTHTVPDFDAAASAYAAYKLHECDHIALCSNMESNVYDFIQNLSFPFPCKRYSDKDIAAIDKIDTLIITDCNNAKRLGRLAALVGKAEKIIIYDHHPDYTLNIPADKVIIQEVGSASSILSEAIRVKGVSLTSVEATFIALGIYEDTGFLTFSKTSAIDASALAWLISQKADTTAANDYIKRELNHCQIMLLNELLLNLSIITIGGVNISYSFASIDEYVDGGAFIAHKLMIMEGLSSLFIILATGGRVLLIGRSRDDRVDVSKIVSVFGGGGHTNAGSAVIKDKMISEAVDALKFAIRDFVKPVKTVKELMTSPAKYLLSSALLKDALDIIIKYNLNNMPVMDNGRVAGIISRRDIMHAVKHGLGNETVEGIMQTEFVRVAPDTPFYDAEEIMVCGNQTLLPVESGNKLVGVVTRTDLLRLMHEDMIIRSKAAENRRAALGVSKNRDISRVLYDYLSDDMVALLKDIGDFAAELDYKAYVVGGFVRDILMGTRNFDLDIVIEGDAAKFASLYGKKNNAKVFIYKHFKTAVVTMPDGFKIDFATARTEYYVTPASAPEVEEASIKSDLFRRDFTVNAMAVRLDGSQFGSLIDFFLGQKDIHDKKIRVLHSLSIIDDPSRAFRAIRFAVRFGFEIGSHTDRLIKHAESLELFSRIAGQRLFSELKYILEEKGYLAALSMMNKYDIMRFYHTDIKYDEKLLSRLNRTESLINWYNIQFGVSVPVWRVRFHVLFFLIKGDKFNKFIDKFELASKDGVSLKNEHKYIEYAASVFKRYKNHKPSFIYGVCSNLSAESALALSAVMGENKQEIVQKYLTSYMFAETQLKGGDLIALGVNKGPEIKKTLDMLLKAKLDGDARTRDDEINFVKTFLLNKNKSDDS